MTPNEILVFLQSIDTFRDVPREQLEWFIREADYVRLEPGFLIRPGDAYDILLIVLEGNFETYVMQGGQKRVQFTASPGTITGLLPFSRMKLSQVYSEILTPATVLSLHKSRFRELTAENFELTEVLVHSLIDRVRLFSSLHFQSEKLMALGKLSAGVAHELNNPASAILRNAGDLQETIGRMSEGLRTIASIHLKEDEVGAISAILDRVNTSISERIPLLERKRREDELLDWLDDHGITDDCATTFVEFGFTERELDEIRQSVSESVFPALLTWLTKSLESQKAIHEIGTASRRISELVQSVKNYTRMDQVQDMQDVCINEGIHNTITMLQHKMRKNNITLHEELAADLPEISGFPGELNQVWTNIIDNALDAMRAGGELLVRTEGDAARVAFIVQDNGPGIPPEHLERIFDPFFTTKEVGEGTGVGLDLVQKIVQQHHGEVRVTSQPGRTVFTVSFPRKASNV